MRPLGERIERNWFGAYGEKSVVFSQAESDAVAKKGGLRLDSVSNSHSGYTNDFIVYV